MAGFDAGQVARPTQLSYDFNPVGVEAKGKIPEPTQGQIDDFQTVFKGLTGKDLAGTNMEDVPDLVDFPALSELVANLCSGKPPLKDLRALPHTVFDAFWGYVSGGFFSADPEPNRAQRRNGTKPSPKAKTAA